MKIYVDILFAINFSMDLISLFLSGIIMRRKVRKKRMFLSSTIGGIYGVIAVIAPISALESAILGVVISLIMCYIAFFEKNIRRLVGIYSIYWGISFCMGGLMNVLYSFLNKIFIEFIKDYSYSQVYTGARFFVVLSLSILLSIILGKFFTNEKEIKEVILEVDINGKKFEMRGLCDSGNLLKEPISGRSVIFVTDTSKLGSEIEKIEDIYKRYIPYSSLGGEGVVKGIISKTVKIDGVERVAIIAPVSKNDFAGYEACIPMSLI